MELVLLIVSTVISLQSSIVRAAPIPPPRSVAECRYPAPIVRPLAGVSNINTCTSTELERQHIKQLDDEATRWLQDGHANPHDHTPDGTTSFPATGRPSSSDIVKEVFVNPTDQDGSRAEDTRRGSYLNVFVSMYSTDTAEKSRVSSKNDVSGSGLGESLFDLPSARKGLSHRLVVAQEQSKAAWKAASKKAYHGVNNANGTVSESASYFIIFMVIGIFMSLAIAIRSGELLFRCGKNAISNSMNSIVCCRKLQATAIQNEKSMRDFRTSFEMIGRHNDGALSPVPEKEEELS